MDWTVGQWCVRLQGDETVPVAALELRAAQFRGGAPDRDGFDASARHLTIEGSDGFVAYARLWTQSAAEMTLGYSSQFYDLAPLTAHHRTAVEIGRVCLASRDAEVPRVLLSALGRIVDDAGASLLYGCASFPEGQTGGLARLAMRVAAEGPHRRAPEVMELPQEGHGPVPTMLRLYLGFGAVVSDHAVIDRDLGTVHVLAMLPIASIPSARARLLRAMAPAG